MIGLLDIRVHLRLSAARQKRLQTRLLCLIAPIQRWVLLPLLLIGLINVPVCYWTVYWGLDWRIGLAGLTMLAFAGGWFTPQKTWGAIVALLMPVMFLGGPSHGRPWQLLIGGLIDPRLLIPLLIYFLINVAPVLVAYVVVVSTGKWARRRLQSL